MQNILDFFRQFNWIDILVFIIFLRLIFVSIKFGLGIEFSKILGTFSGLYLALHYYFSLAGYLNGRIGNQETPGSFLEFSAFLFLFTLGYLTFWLLRVLVFRCMNADINPILNRWGGLCLGLLRAFLISSLILFAFLIPKSQYFKDSIYYSLSGNYLTKTAPAIYTWVWESIVSKFNSREKFNDKIFEVNSHGTKQTKYYNKSRKQDK